MKFFLLLALVLVGANAEQLRQRELLVPTLEHDGRITNGKDAAIGQFPYQVGLRLKISTYQSAWCGGSLISNQWVLTAAHCTDGVQSVTVVLGATDRFASEIEFVVQKSNIIIHANWDSSTLKNDISLIKIPSVSFSSRIQPIKLPSIASSYATYAGTYATASGWGRTSDGATSVTSHLQYAPLQIISNTQCAGTFGKIITAGNICAATPGGVSTCNGDSGGPLVSETDNIQIGLTSFGAAAGCEKGFPVAFTRLTTYLEWIKEKTSIAY